MSAPDGWLPSVLIRESWLNLATSPMRLVLAAAILTGLCAASAYLELATARDAEDLQRTLVSRGIYGSIVRSEAGLSAAACEALNYEPWVAAAGAVAPTRIDSFANAPRTRFQFGEVSPGYVAVASGTSARIPPGRGLVLGAAAARELQLAAGSLVSLEGAGSLEVLATAPEVAARGAESDRWVMELSTLDFAATECWVEVVAGAAAGANAALSHWFGPETEVDPMLASNELTRDPAADVRERPQSGAWIPVGVVVGAIIGIVNWMRRSELALYRALGLGRGGLLLMTQLEAAILISVACISGLAWATAVVVVQSGMFELAHVAFAARTTILASCLGLLLAAAWPFVLAGESVLSQLRDR